MTYDCVAACDDKILSLAPNLIVEQDLKRYVALGDQLFPKPFIVSDALHNNSFLPVKPRAYAANIELVSPARIELYYDASQFCIGAQAFLDSAASLGAVADFFEAALFLTVFFVAGWDATPASFFDVFAAISIPFNCCGGNLKWVFTALMNILSNAIICDYKFFFQIFNNEKIKKTLPINIVKIQCL